MSAEKSPIDSRIPDASPERPVYMRVFALAVLLIAAWILWSGFFKPLLLGLGAISCLLTLYVVRRMGYFDNETYAFRYGFRLFGFWGWLAREIVSSSIEVARIVLSREIKVDPRIVNIDAGDLDPVDQAVFGNSITLTPGTLTLDVYEGKLRVHALTAEGAAALERGDMHRRVMALRER